MKFILSSIFFILVALGNPNKSYSQNSINDFSGKWRWISGTGDTLTLVLKQISGQEKLTGFHSFSHNGSILDNSIPETPHRTYDSATIYGQMANSEKTIFQYVIQDHPRKSIYIGNIELLDKNKNIALFYTTKTERPHLFYDPSNPIPSGRTFPDNLILTRIPFGE